MDPTPAPEGTPDGGAADAGGADAGFDAGEPGSDAGWGADGGKPDAGPSHVHVYISNTCQTSTNPSQLSAPLNSGLKLAFHNHSTSYEADVWSSRGYGFLELPLGATWNDPVTHCGGPNPYMEYFDISIAGGPGSACPGVRFKIYCQ